MAAHQAALHKKHRTHPTITLLAPIAVNLPILVVFSLTIRHALDVPGSAMAIESLGWITRLMDGDMLLAALGGGLGMVNAELVEGRRAALERQGEAAVVEKARTPEPKPARREPSVATSRTLSKRSLSTSQPSGRSPTPPRRPPPQVEKAQSTTTPARTSPSPELVDVDEGAPSSERQSHLINKIMTNALRAGALFFLCVGPSVPSVSRYLVPYPVKCASADQQGYGRAWCCIGSRP